MIPAPALTLLPLLPAQLVADKQACDPARRAERQRLQHKLDSAIEDWSASVHHNLARQVDSSESALLVQELLAAWWWTAAHLVQGTDSPCLSLGPGAVGWALVLLREIGFALETLLRRLYRSTQAPQYLSLRESVSQSTAEALARFQWAFRAVYGEEAGEPPTWTDRHGVEHTIARWPDSVATTAAIRDWREGRSHVEAGL